MKKILMVLVILISLSLIACDISVTDETSVYIKDAQLEAKELELLKNDSSQFDAFEITTKNASKLGLVFDLKVFKDGDWTQETICIYPLLEDGSHKMVFYLPNVLYSEDGGVEITFIHNRDCTDYKYPFKLDNYNLKDKYKFENMLVIDKEIIKDEENLVYSCYYSLNNDVSDEEGKFEEAIIVSMKLTEIKGA